MSTRTVSIKIPKVPPSVLGASGRSLPWFFQSVIAKFAPDVLAKIEAPAFYGSVQMRYWGSGTRTVDNGTATITDTISYDVTKTFTRIDMRADAVHQDTYQMTDGCYDYFTPQVGGDVGTVGSPATGCYIGILQGGAGRDNPIPHIARHYLALQYYHEEEDYNVGSRHTDYDNPATTDTTDDLLAYITFDPPLWDYIGGTGPADAGSPYDAWVVPFGPDIFNFPAEGVSLDISGIDWRDLRDTFVGSVNDSDLDDSWDTNNVVHNVSVTIS